MSDSQPHMDVYSLSEETFFEGGKIRVVMQDSFIDVKSKPLIKRKLFQEFENAVECYDLLTSSNQKDTTEPAPKIPNPQLSSTKDLNSRKQGSDIPEKSRTSAVLITENSEQQRLSSEVSAARLASILAKIKTLKVKPKSSKKKTVPQKKPEVVTERLLNSGKKLNASSSKPNFMSVGDRRSKAKSQEGHRFVGEENSQGRLSLMGSKRSRELKKVKEICSAEQKLSKFDAMKSLLQNIHSVKSKIGLYPSKSPIRENQSATRVKSQNLNMNTHGASRSKLFVNPTQPFHISSLHNLQKSRLMQKKPTSSLAFSQLPKGASTSTRVLVGGGNSTRHLKHPTKGSIGYNPVPLVHPGMPGAGTTIQATTLNIIGSTFTVNSAAPPFSKMLSTEEAPAVSALNQTLPQNVSQAEQFFWPSSALAKASVMHAKPSRDGYGTSLDFGGKRSKQHLNLQNSTQAKQLGKAGPAGFRRTLSTSILIDTKTLKKAHTQLPSGSSMSQRLPAKGTTIKKLSKPTHKSTAVK